MKNIKDAMNTVAAKAHIVALEAVEKLKEEDGLGTMELVLIMLVMIALVIIFKDKVTAVLKNLLDSVEQNGNQLV